MNPWKRHVVPRLDDYGQRLGRLRDQAASHTARWLDDPPFPDWRQVPVVVTSFNRLTCLDELLRWLGLAGMRRIVVLDNGSTYPPLLRYLERITSAEVVRLGRNLGPFALWKTKLWTELRRSYYVLTDPDVVPAAECPAEAVEHLHGVLTRHPRALKAGLGLRIDDLPDHYDRKAQVIAWESQFWRKELSPGVYDARPDTTFALYRPGARGGWWIPGVRTGPPYVARHVPWYCDSSAPDQEELHYRSAIKKGSTHWTPASTLRTRQ